MKRIIIITIACCLFFTAQASAQPPCRNAELTRLATRLALAPDSLHEGYCHLRIGGRDVTVLVRDSVVCHIGQTLFPDAFKTGDNALLFNFLERYALQLKMPQPDKTAALMLRDDDVTFSHGSPATFSSIDSTKAFSFTKKDGRYACTWSNGEKTLLALSFPAEYQLLCGENKIEVEQRLEKELLRTVVSDTLLVQPDTASLSPTPQPQFFVERRGSYLDDRLNADLYYEQTDSAAFRLISDSSFPAESLANAMLTPAAPGSYTLRIDQSLYGYASKQITVPLRQWLAYCQQSGCKLYFGVEQTDSASVRAMLMAVNTQADYNHLLTFTVPFSVIDSQQGTIEARLFSFVPMHNVKDIFGK